MNQFSILKIMLALAFLALLALVSSPLMADSKSDGDRLFEEARKLREQACSNEDLKEAVTKYEEALSIYRKIDDLRGEGLALNSLGIVYRNWGQYDKAKEYFEKSLEIARKIGDLLDEGNVLLNLGLVYADWGQYAKAVELYEKSLEIKRKIGDLQGEGQTLNNLGLVYADWGQHAKAVEFYEKSLEITRKLDNLEMEARTLNNLGLVYRDWSQYAKAKECFEKSLETKRKIGDLRSEGLPLANLGLVYRDWGQYDKAKECFEKSLEIARKFGDVQNEARILTMLGLAYMHWGQYARAKEYFEESREITRKIGDLPSEGRIVNNLGLLYTDWGQYAKAVECYEESLETTRKIGDVLMEGTTLNNLGVLYADRGQYARAVEYYEKSLEIKRKLRDVKGEGQTLINLGEVYRDRREYNSALTSFQKGLDVYVKIGVPEGWPRDLIGNLYLDMGASGKAEPFIREAGYKHSLGRLSLLRSDYQKAKEYYEEIRQSAEKNRDAANLFTAYTGLGTACERLGDMPAAAEYFRKAIDHTEELRAGLSPGERTEFYNVRVGGFPRTTPYDGLARVMMRLNKPEDALKQSEYTKARVFSELLSRRAGGANLLAPKDVIDTDSQLNDQLGALSKNLQKAYEKENNEVIAVLEPQVREAKEKLAAHVDRLRREYPLFASTKYPQPMALAQTDLKEHEWVLSYHVTDSGMIIYLTKGKKLVKSLLKLVPRTEVEELVRKFRQPLELEPKDYEECHKQNLSDLDCLKRRLIAFDFATGKKLADLLLGGILTEAPKNAPLIIVPDQCLGVAPFEMLVLNEGGRVDTDRFIPYAVGAEFFGDRNPLSYYQSITALTLSRRLGKKEKAGDKILAMVDPVFGGDDDDRWKKGPEKRQQVFLKSMSIENGMNFSRLEDTALLGESLKKDYPNKIDLYEGLDATKSVLLGTDLTRYNIVAFATHGYYGKALAGIQEPVLALTLVGLPEGQDGFLRLREVMGLHMNCSIAALLACQTGLGRQISGEGIMGMGRAFQYAGAKSVLMSLWSVAITPSINLVESFFKYLREGKNKREALRLARDEIRKAGFDHPFFWAPFILVGEVD